MILPTTVTLESPRLPRARGRVWGSLEWHDVHYICVLDHCEKGHASQWLDLTGEGACRFHQEPQEGQRGREGQGRKVPRGGEHLDECGNTRGAFGAKKMTWPLS